MTNSKNRTIFCGDNLDILRGINSESVDLIYLDPPFKIASMPLTPIPDMMIMTSFSSYWHASKVLNIYLPRMVAITP